MINFLPVREVDTYLDQLSPSLGDLKYLTTGCYPYSTENYLKPLVSYSDLALLDVHFSQDNLLVIFKVYVSSYITQEFQKKVHYTGNMTYITTTEDPRVHYITYRTDKPFEDKLQDMLDFLAKASSVRKVG